MTDEQEARERVEELYYGMWPVDMDFALDRYRDAIVAATKVEYDSDLWRREAVRPPESVGFDGYIATLENMLVALEAEKTRLLCLEKEGGI